jgi:hypothetical protein
MSASNSRGSRCRISSISATSRSSVPSTARTWVQAACGSTPTRSATRRTNSSAPNGWQVGDAPVGLYFAIGKRSVELLGGLKDWMGHRSAVILSGLCLVIGVKLLGDGLSGLSP